MKLSEKILYCRKKMGCSQEQLAHRLGISRQAVSKWETGESEPEISKLRLLAEEESESPREEPAAERRSDFRTARPAADRMEQLPRFLGRMVRRFGWLAGVVVMLYGCGFAVVGGLARYLSIRMMQGAQAAIPGLSGFPGTTQIIGGTVFESSGMISGFPGVGFNPVAAMGTVILVIGLAVIVAGLLLTLYLRRKFRS